MKLALNWPHQTVLENDQDQILIIVQPSQLNQAVTLECLHKGCSNFQGERVLRLSTWHYKMGYLGQQVWLPHHNVFIHGVTKPGCNSRMLACTMHNFQAFTCGHSEQLLSKMSHDCVATMNILFGNFLFGWLKAHGPVKWTQKCATTSLQQNYMIFKHVVLKGVTTCLMYSPSVCMSVHPYV